MPTIPSRVPRVAAFSWDDIIHAINAEQRARRGPIPLDQHLTIFDEHGNAIDRGRAIIISWRDT